MGTEESAGDGFEYVLAFVDRKTGKAIDVRPTALINFQPRFNPSDELLSGRKFVYLFYLINLIINFKAETSRGLFQGLLSEQGRCPNRAPKTDGEFWKCQEQENVGGQYPAQYYQCLFHYKKKT